MARRSYTFESITKSLNREKVVVRKYQTKSGPKVKIYRYSNINTAIYENGQFNQKAVATLVNRINKITDSTERRKYMNELSAIVQQVKGGKLPNFTGKLTIGGVLGRISANKAYNYLTTNGFDVNQICKDYNLDIDELLDENNWDDDIFSGVDKDGNNIMLEFLHNYNVENDIIEL